MRPGELLTRATIWISLLAYLAGSFTFGRNSRSWDSNRISRIAWSIACISLLLHVVSAYNFYHQWSQDSAYLDTARQTNEVVGINWGGGLYINYAILLLWIADVSLWWLQGVESYRQQLWTLRVVWHTILIFIIVNATIVFKSGTVRWFGIVYCSALLFAWMGESVKQKLFSARKKITT